ncbi:lipase 3 [Folsomia candida]|uniref:lipase 3 n=1 Tax=Folsomia candida TaxID=158441 RepID=UPI001604BBB5|nr:lipase 3 [Folsomia candida]
MVALAPVVYINNMMGFPRLFGPFHKVIKIILDILGNGEFLPPWLTRIYNAFGTKFCSNTWIAETVCANINFLFAGWDLPQTQINQLPLFYNHTPSPTSTKTVAHIVQFIHTGIYCQYDYGHRENMMRYGSSVPPRYNVKNTTVPVALLWGPNDAVVNPIDVKRLASQLPNLVFNSPVQYPLWNHFDYHLGKDADQLVNPVVINLLSSWAKK